VTHREIDCGRTTVRSKTTAPYPHPHPNHRPLRLPHARVSSLWANLWTIIKWEISNFRNVQLASKTARSHRPRRLFSCLRTSTPNKRSLLCLQFVFVFTFSEVFLSPIWYKYMYRRCLWNYHLRYFLIFCLFFVYHCTISHAVQLFVLTYVSIRLWLLIVLLWLSWGLNCLFVYWLSNFLTFPIIFRLNNANCLKGRRRCECRINSGLVCAASFE